MAQPLGVFCPGGTAQIPAGNYTSVNGVIETVFYSVAITVAGVATDCQFFLMLHPGEANAPTSPVTPLDNDRNPACTVNGNEKVCVLAGTP